MEGQTNSKANRSEVTDAGNTRMAGLDCVAIEHLARDLVLDEPC